MRIPFDKTTDGPAQSYKLFQIFVTLTANLPTTDQRPADEQNFFQILCKIRSIHPLSFPNAVNRKPNERTKTMKTTMQICSNWNTSARLLMLCLALSILAIEAARAASGITPLCASLHDVPGDALMSDGLGVYCGGGTTPPHFNRQGQFVFVPPSGRAVNAVLTCVSSCVFPPPGSLIDSLRLVTQIDVRNMTPGTETTTAVSIGIRFKYPNNKVVPWYVNVGSPWLVNIGWSCAGPITYATVTRSTVEVDGGKTWTLTIPNGPAVLSEENPKPGKTSLTPRGCILFPGGIQFGYPPAP